MKHKKKFGPGSLALLLLILGVYFSVSFNNKPSFGDHVLTFLGLTPWSKGDSGIHYTVYFALIFFIPASILGYTFRNDWGAKVGRIISTIISVILIFSIFLIII